MGHVALKWLHYIYVNFDTNLRMPGSVTVYQFPYVTWYLKNVRHAVQVSAGYLCIKKYQNNSVYHDSICEINVILVSSNSDS